MFARDSLSSSFPMLSTPTFSGFTIPETAGGVWRYCAVYSFHSTDVSFRLHAALGGPSLFPVRDSRLRLSTFLVHLSTSFLIHVCDICVRIIHCRRKGAGGGVRGSTCGEPPLPILCIFSIENDITAWRRRHRAFLLPRFHVLGLPHSLKANPSSYSHLPDPLWRPRISVRHHRRYGGN